MDETYAVDGEPAQAENFLDFERVLRAITLRCDAAADPRLVDSVAREASSRVAREPISWPEALVGACAPLGLAATHARVPLGRLLAGVGRARPAVLSGADETLFFVSERRGRRLLVEGLGTSAPSWKSEPEIAALLGTDRTPDAVVIEAAMPSLGSEAAPAHADDHHGHGPRPIVRLLAWAVGERSDLLAVLAYAVFVGLASLVTPIAVQVIVGTVTFGTLLQPLVVVAVMLAAGLAFASALRASSAWVVEVLERRFFARVTTALAERLPRAVYDGDHPGAGPGLADVNRFFDVFTFQKASAALLSGALEVVLTAVVGMVVLAFYHPWLLAFDFVLVTIVLLVVVAPARRGTDTSTAESIAKHELAVHLQSIASQRRAHQTGHAAALAGAITSHGARRWLEARSAHFRVSFTQLACLLGLEAIASASLLGIGGFLVIDRQLTLGQLVAAELIVTAVVAALAKTGKHLASYYDLAAAVDKVGSLIDALPRSVGGVAVPDQGPLAVTLEDSSEGATLALDVPAGGRVVVRLDDPDARERVFETLLGTSRPAGARTRVGGVDLRDADLERLHRRIVVVLADAVYVASVLDNVRAGDPQIAPRTALAAIERVGLGPLLDVLPERANAVIASPLFAKGGAARIGHVDAVRLGVARALTADAGLVIVAGALDDVPGPVRLELAGALATLEATLVVLTGRSEVERAFDRGEVR